MTKAQFESKYNVSLTAFQQGSRISVSDLEKILGCSHTTAEFMAKSHFFSQQLQKKLWDDDKKWVVNIKKGEVCVLTDQEASHYCEDQNRIAVRRLKRTNKEMSAVNRRHLTPQRRREHDQELMFQGLELQDLKAIRKRKPPPPQPVQQTIPPDRPIVPRRPPQSGTQPPLGWAVQG